MKKELEEIKKKLDVSISYLKHLLEKNENTSPHLVYADDELKNNLISMINKVKDMQKNNTMFIEEIKSLLEQKKQYFSLDYHQSEKFSKKSQNEATSWKNSIKSLIALKQKKPDENFTTVLKKGSKTKTSILQEKTHLEKKPPDSHFKI